MKANLKSADLRSSEEVVFSYGWKCLNQFGATERDGQLFQYNTPQRGQKWSGWTEYPSPAKPDGEDCGGGRLHIYNKPTSAYAPRNWWMYYARYLKSDIVGQSSEKTAVTRLQLRIITPKVFWRMIRFGWMREADLSGADLSEANLSGANLRWANLSEVIKNEYTVGLEEPK